MSRPARNLPRICASLFACFSAIATASADTVRRPVPPAPKPDADDLRDHPLALSSGLDATIVRSRGSGFRRLNYVIGIALFPTRWLQLSTDLRIGYAGFTYNGKAGENVTLTGDLSKDGHVTLTSGARITLLERRRVRWSIFGEYETSFGNDALSVDSVSIGLGGDNTLDLTDYIRQHGRFSFAWRRFAVGTSIIVHTGRVSPTFSVAFEKLTASVDVGLDDESRNTLNAFGQNAGSVERRHTLDHNTASFYPGIDILLPKRMHLAIEAMIVPIPDGWAFGASARYIFRP